MVRMLIIAGYELVDPENRDALVDAHRDLVARARQAPGCLDVAISADPIDARWVNSYERWESRELLDQWRAVANAPDTGIPIHEADVRMYDANNERPPF
jgi:quinol monooxygenase YgiN